MSYSSNDLNAAADAGIITATQCDALLAYLGARGTDVNPRTGISAPAFDLVHLLWYAGALIVMGAMGLFSTLAFAQMGGGALTLTALVYAALFAMAGHYLWTARNLRTPGGLLIAIAVSMAPLAVYGIEDALGLWDDAKKPGTIRAFYEIINGGWIWMEVAAIAAAGLALRFYRFPFLVLIPAIALWFMSMDVVPWIVGAHSIDFDTRRKVSIFFGLAIIATAVAVNARQRTGDFAFWLYLFGVIAFWGGVSATSGGTALAKAIYCAMNVSFIFLAVFLGRRVFAVFGTIGIAMYLGDLAEKMFKDSLLFPFSLSLIGVAVIALGLWLHRHQDALRMRMDAMLPAPLRALRPAR